MILPFTIARGLLLAAILLPGAVLAAPNKIDVFTGGEAGYHTYRIPALAIGASGTVLAFSEARKNSPSDAGDIDLVLKRSADGGVTWGPMQWVHEEGGDAPITIGNPCPIVAGDNIHLFFTRNNRRLFHTHSTDDGASWSDPKERTEMLRGVDFPWVRIGTGPVHGIQRANGELVAPIWYCSAEPGAEGIRYRSGVLLGSPDGSAWRAGGLVPERIPRLNECTVAERADGVLYLNMRAYKAGHRATATSADGGQIWTEPVPDESLPDPTCQGSILRLADGQFAFANIPNATSRSGLALRRSADEGRTWSNARVLETGPSAYSDLAQRGDGTLLCLFERGDQRYNEKIAIAHIDPAWLAAD